MLTPNRIVSRWYVIQLQAHNLLASAANVALICEKLRHESELCPREVETVCFENREPILLLTASIHLIVAEAENVGLSMTQAAAGRVAYVLNQLQDTARGFTLPRHLVDRLIDYGAQLNQTFSDEIASKKVYVLRPELAHLYSEASGGFGAEVIDTFPEAIEDIEEASKCLALGRSTACIFHLMRAMELAVRQMAGRLGILNVEKEWGKLLSEISGKVEKLPKGPDRDAWSEAHSHLYHVKQAWRNSTMHPKKTYTDVEAKAVFDAVGSFMRHLAPLVPPT
ncbi:HEPN domain-containing protein [Altererythrobacter atlanticus]|uniref:Uncharacterized protein n=1 Tax=Croceibacterium atlanticum TaxID=1267766 RepID=A0A0F7KYR7_9SPHN|nr:hypothetical protein [Croceibacterium atlanticum]AKH44309.1 hypothetical protein WYH_03290 [Croceibacterium atlanticum]MBB5733908.1 HEPN domain-containing protein [Croceibacterium atlanticum]